MKMDRRPLYAGAIIFAVMLALVLGQRFIHGLTWLWIPLGLLLVFIFQRYGWLPTTPQFATAPPVVVRVLCALLGVVLMALIYWAYRSPDQSRAISIVGLGVGPIVALVLWLALRRKSDQPNDNPPSS